eukprot:TRINITY_DN1848_c0_g1_i6.p1 TRINITY_DN1848_c0_g1~~TRINITY_DN1848_c0_g1_i6.p1  ORF type:complete len:127 (-),score=13.93 TRINITY_DN1848_c0_g1_i6:649-1029(-)
MCALTVLLLRARFSLNCFCAVSFGVLFFLSRACVSLSRLSLSLSLRWNNIGPEGAAHLADALRVNSLSLSLSRGFNGLDNGTYQYSRSLSLSFSLMLQNGYFLFRILFSFFFFALYGLIKPWTAIL